MTGVMDEGPEDEQELFMRDAEDRAKAEAFRRQQIDPELRRYAEQAQAAIDGRELQLWGGPRDGERVTLARGEPFPREYVMATHVKQGRYVREGETRRYRWRQHG